MNDSKKTPTYDFAHKITAVGFIILVLGGNVGLYYVVLDEIMPLWLIFPVRAGVSFVCFGALIFLIRKIRTYCGKSS